MFASILDYKVRWKLIHLKRVIIFTCYICRYTSVEIMPELKKNIFKFGYGINFKYEGMLTHSFDRFYVFYLPSLI